MTDAPAKRAQMLAEHLRAAREQAGLTQAAAGTYLNLDSTAITRMENGTRTVAALELAVLSELYRVPVTDLLRLTPDIWRIRIDVFYAEIPGTVTAYDGEDFHHACKRIGDMVMSEGTQRITIYKSGKLYRRILVDNTGAGEPEPEQRRREL